MSPATSSDRPLAELSEREVRALFNHHSSIVALGVLWCLGAAGTLVLALPVFLGSELPAGFREWTMDGPNPLLAVVLCNLAGFQLLSAVGCFRREAWARFCGMAQCVVMLLGGWFALLLGLLGLVAFARGGRLFGPQRLSGRELKADLRQRKLAAA